MNVTRATRPLKEIAYRHKWGVVAANVYQDLMRRVGVVSGQIGNPYTVAQTNGDLPQALNAINHTFDMYLRHLEPSDLEGARVLEVGPGHNVGVALRFIAAGASRVVCLDKFVPFQMTSFHRMLYLALGDQFAGPERRRFEDALRMGPPLGLDESRVSYVFGRGIDRSAHLFPAASFDLIVSNAVLEEAWDADAAFEAMDRWLSPGGCMVHVIDLRDYGMFSKHGFHPLEFLTLPDVIYRHMVEFVGQPNRRLVDFYRATMARFGYASTIYATWIVGARNALAPPTATLASGIHYSDGTVKLIEAIRPRLLERYRGMSEEDLAVASILLVATKPRAGTAISRAPIGRAG